MLDPTGPGAPAEAKADLPVQESPDRQQSPIPQLRRFLLFSKASPWSLGQGTDETSTTAQVPSEPLKRPSSLLELGNQQQASDANRRRATSDSTRPRDVTVRFREPQGLDLIHSTTPSDEEASLAGSDISDQTKAQSPHKKPRRTRRRATRFALGYPAPQLRTKQRSFLQIRPRILLQLQELGEKRAMPAFDVVPSSLIAGSLIIPKLCKRFPRMFRAKPCLGQDDLLLVRSEQHGLSSTPSEKAENNLDDRDVLAVVVTTTDHDHDSVEIVFQDGTAWTTSLMANGSYEFTSINEHGEISRARWVRKTVTPPRTTGMAADAASNADSAAAAAASSRSSSPHHGAQMSPPPFEYKWTFSMMDPCTRRHPIQGVLTTATLDIFDCYIPPSEKGERVAVAVTEDNKNLMLATAIWISLRQKGWPGTAVPKLARVMMSHNPSSGNGNGNGNVVAAAAAAAAAAARCQSPPPVHTLGRGASRSLIGLDAAVAAGATAAAPQASSSSPARLKQGIVKRAVSSGGEFMMRRRRRRETYESTEPDIDEAAEDKLRVHDGTPVTCRAKIRRLTHRLFHPRSQWVL